VYSWRGAHQSRQLIATIKFFARLEATNKTDLFVKKRAEFEGFLVKYRSIPAQIIRKWGGKPQTSERLAEFFQDLFEKVADGKTEKEIIGSLIFKPEEASPGTPGEDFSEAVKSGVALRDLLRSALQCKECHAPMPSWCMSPDHSDPKRDGGSSGAKNLAYMHPRCNHGVKEQRSARDKKS
jgi:hypothetical protein